MLFRASSRTWAFLSSSRSPTIWPKRRQNSPLRIGSINRIGPTSLKAILNILSLPNGILYSQPGPYAAFAIGIFFRLVGFCLLWCLLSWSWLKLGEFQTTSIYALTYTCRFVLRRMILLKAHLFWLWTLSLLSFIYFNFIIINKYSKKFGVKK